MEQASDNGVDLRGTSKVVDWSREPKEKIAPLTIVMGDGIVPGGQVVEMVVSESAGLSRDHKGRVGIRYEQVIVNGFSLPLDKVKLYICSEMTRSKLTGRTKGYITSGGEIWMNQPRTADDIVVLLHELGHSLHFKDMRESDYGRDKSYGLGSISEAVSQLVDFFGDDDRKEINRILSRERMANIHALNLIGKAKNQDKDMFPEDSGLIRVRKCMESGGVVHLRSLLKEYPNAMRRIGKRKLFDYLVY